MSCTSEGNPSYSVDGNPSAPVLFCALIRGSEAMRDPVTPDVLVNNNPVCRLRSVAHAS